MTENVNVHINAPNSELPLSFEEPVDVVVSDSGHISAYTLRKRKYDGQAIYVESDKTIPERARSRIVNELSEASFSLVHLE